MATESSVKLHGQKKTRGGARPGAGRPKGVGNRLHRDYRDKVLGKYDVQPSEYTLQVLNAPFPDGSGANEKGENANGDPCLPKICEQRMEAAKGAAPYVHPRLEVVPITMFEGLGDGNKFTIDSTKLSDEELDTLEKLLLKAQHKRNGNGSAPVNGNQVH